MQIGWNEEKHMSISIHTHHYGKVRILPSYFLGPTVIPPSQHDICSNMYFVTSLVSQRLV
jgi:hypothetical protein